MKQLSDTMKWFSPLRFVVDSLALSSSAGRLQLYGQKWITSILEIKVIHDTTERLIEYFSVSDKKSVLEDIAYVLRDLRSIEATIGVLQNPDASVSDIDLFELKNLALIESKVTKRVTEANINILPLPSLKEVLSILDIDHEELPGFYLSDKYSDELARLRKEQEAANSNEELERIALLVAQEEDRVRRVLTEQLRPYSTPLSEALEALASMDLFIAKAHWAIENTATKPIVIEKGLCSLQGIVNPEVKFFLSRKNVDFQPVDISFGAFPTIITGANMAGKSVLLHTIGLVQMLLQYGFFVPAEHVELSLVEEVMLSMDDASDQSKGLSSFGGEMIRLSKMAKKAKTGIPLLLLIDEAARTTNPLEGRAIVEGLVAFFAKYNTCAIITTHYSGIRGEANRLRIKGFIEENLKQPLKVANLNSYIDYSLVKEESESTPREALRIAEILGVDKELLDNCRYCIEQDILIDGRE